MKSYLYTGSQPHNVSIREKSPEGEISIRNIRLTNGDKATLDESNPIINSLIVQGLLKEDLPVRAKNIQENFKKISDVS